MAAGANAVVFSGASDVVAAYGDGRVRFWGRDGSEMRDALQVDSDGDAVFSVAVSPDRSLLAAAGATDGVTLWNIDTGERRSELNGQPAAPLDVAFTSLGDALVSSNREGIITLWNSATGQAIGPRVRVSRRRGVEVGRDAGGRRGHGRRRRDPCDARRPQSRSSVRSRCRIPRSPRPGALPGRS